MSKFIWIGVIASILALFAILNGAPLIEADSFAGRIETASYWTGSGLVIIGVLALFRADRQEMKGVRPDALHLGIVLVGVGIALLPFGSGWVDVFTSVVFAVIGMAMLYYSAGYLEWKAQCVRAFASHLALFMGTALAQHYVSAGNAIDNAVAAFGVVLILGIIGGLIAPRTVPAVIRREAVA